MFQFTREFIINEDLNVSADKVANLLILDGVASYTLGKDNTGMDRIIGVKEVPFKKAAAPSIAIPFATNATKDQRLVIKAGLYRSTEASYANMLVADMQKTFQFEIPAGYSIDQAILLIKSVMKRSDHAYFNVSKDTANIKITGVNGYQSLSAKLFVSTGINSAHENQWTVVTAIAKALGEVGFGTYERLIQNDRLPTLENMNYFSVNKFEMPVIGAEYKLFEFNYNSGIRNIGGSGVVGSYERSITTHRFWINTKAALPQFDKAIVALNANTVAADIPVVTP